MSSSNAQGHEPESAEVEDDDDDVNYHYSTEKRDLGFMKAYYVKTTFSCGGDEDLDICLIVYGTLSNMLQVPNV